MFLQVEKTVEYPGNLNPGASGPELGTKPHSPAL